jgi:hypothetical protein
MSPQQTADPQQLPSSLNGALSSEPPSASPPQKPSHFAWFAAGGALILVLAAIATVILLSDSNSNNRKSVVVVSNAAYQQKIMGVLTPLVSANQRLSAALTALDGSSKTIFAAQNGTTAAQTAVVAAKGAFAVLTVPQPSLTLSQQAVQALTQESGYLQAVNATLGNPLGNTTASLQPLASATASAFVPLDAIVPGGSTSISGVPNLLNWVAGATAAAQRQKQVTPPTTTTIIATPPTTTTPPTLAFTPGDENSSDGFASQCSTTMLIGPDSDCSVAEQVSNDLSNGNVAGTSFSDTVTDNANEPATDGQTITFGCSYTGNYYHCGSRDQQDWFDFNQ